jgi:hypothetical protein
MQTNNTVTNDTQPTSEYLLLFRGKDWDEGMPLDELQRVMDEVMTWYDDLAKRGLIKGGQPLARSGRVVSGVKGRGVTDGPFVESKEGIGGYLILRAESEAEAVAVAKSSPTLFHGITVEVRPLLDECPCFVRANRRLKFAAA